MNVFQRLFNRLFPLEDSEDTRPGAMGLHIDAPWMDQAARVHDRRDDAIRDGAIHMTYSDNDQDFAQMLRDSEQRFPFLNNFDRRRAMLIDALSRPAIRLYRAARGQR